MELPWGRGIHFPTFSLHAKIASCVCAWGPRGDGGLCVNSTHRASSSLHLTFPLPLLGMSARRGPESARFKLCTAPALPPPALNASLSSSRQNSRPWLGCSLDCKGYRSLDWSRERERERPPPATQPYSQLRLCDIAGRVEDPLAPLEGELGHLGMPVSCLPTAQSI